MHKATFSIDDDQAFYGYSDGTRWNGWARPHFTKEQANKIVEWVNSMLAPEHKDRRAYYNEDNDTFVFPDAWGDDRYEEVYPMIQYEGMLPLYPVGAGCWIWDEWDVEVPEEVQTHE